MLTLRHIAMHAMKHKPFDRTDCVNQNDAFAELVNCATFLLTGKTSPVAYGLLTRKKRCATSGESGETCQ
jgi:hypothetical protein